MAFEIRRSSEASRAARKSAKQNEDDFAEEAEVIWEEES